MVVHYPAEPQGNTFQDMTAKDAALFTPIIKEALKISVPLVNTFRLGKKLPEKPHLLFATLESASIKYILKSVPQLRDSVHFSNIYFSNMSINPDMTQKEWE